jgi:hypothetical protein
MDYAVLRNELLNNPAGITGGYVGLTDQEAADKLNALTTGRSRNRTAVPIQEVVGQVNDAAWPTTAILQDKWRGIYSMPVVDASNSNTRGILGAIFPNSGNTAATNARLLALATETISRATELGLGNVTVGDVNLARSKPGGW